MNQVQTLLRQFRVDDMNTGEFHVRHGLPVGKQPPEELDQLLSKREKELRSAFFDDRYVPLRS